MMDKWFDGLVRIEHEIGYLEEEYDEATLNAAYQAACAETGTTAEKIIDDFERLLSAIEEHVGDNNSP
jgi:hypothetical protein